MISSDHHPDAYVIPGEDLGSAAEWEAGPGTHIVNGRVLASLCGQRKSHPSAAASASGRTSAAAATVYVERRGGRQTVLPRVGAIVLCRVTRITLLAASVDIHAVDDAPLHEPAAAVIRKENIRESEIDKIKVEACFQPGDVVRAVVLSLGDARSYFLTTAAVHLGVVSAFDENGTPLEIASSESLRDASGALHPRKVAKV